MEKLARIMTVTVFLCSVLVVLGAASCPEKYAAWHPMSFSTMFRHRDIRNFIKGRISRIFPPKHIPHFGQEVITAQVEIECIYRGGAALQRMPVINITGFGHSHDCVNTLVTVGDTYLIFLEPFSHVPQIQFVVKELNLQRGAFEATGLKIAKVTSVYVCRRPVSGLITTLPPWRSLTPIKQLPVFIPPRGFNLKQIPMVKPGTISGAQQTRPYRLLPILVIVLMLSLN